MPEVHVGLGSNIAPERQLKRAVAELERRFGRLRRSAVFRSPPFGFEGDDFLNLVVALVTAAAPDDVEAALHDIEYEGGRLSRGPRFAARKLDLDLLLYGEMVDAGRRLPREDVRRYPFVLAPLAELAPAQRHPLTGRTFAAEWAALRARQPRLARIGDLDRL